MDRRGWPWKKKSSDKTAEKTVSGTDSVGASLASAGSYGDQDKPKKKNNHVQISVESYEHLTGLEEEVKTLNDQVNTLNDEVNTLNDEVSALNDEVNTLNDEVNTLNEQLSSAQSEMTTKDNLVKQHAKVAEEAVSGWEKAEAEAAALKHQLESVTLLKLTAEDKTAHLDGALKECMRQIRNLKEENERKLHEVILTKTKQLDKIKLDFEAKLSDLDQELLRSAADNSALSRALQERSNMLMKINEEKSQVETENEHLKSNIESCEREISSLKYELHVISKEIDIRNEEKNMSMRSAEVANKQHIEGVKKIAKLEAELQRLRGLVRKKLPGPAALAQMKLEVENLGRDYIEPRSRRSPGQSPNPQLTPLPEFSLENVQKIHKETEFLTGRMLAMEEETKMLKEALAKRNCELQTSRNMCARTVSKLRGLEAQVHVLNQHKSSPRMNIEMPAEGSSSQNASNPPSLTSMSEDGIDEEANCAESWATALISELSHFKKERDVDKQNKADSTTDLQLMDDFLEMEKLACQTPESNGAGSISPSSVDTKTEKLGDRTYCGPTNGRGTLSEHESNLESRNLVLPDKILPVANIESDSNEISISKLRSRFSMIFDSEVKDTDIGKILQDIKSVMQDIQEALPQHSPSCILNKSHSGAIAGKQQTCTQDIRESPESGIFATPASKPGTPQNGIFVTPDTKPGTPKRRIFVTPESKPESPREHIVDQELATAIHQIHDFVVSLSKEAMEIHGSSPDGHVLCQNAEDFSGSVDEVLSGKMDLGDFMLELSHVLAKASELNLKLLGYKGNEGEIMSSDCIDKVTLLEKKVVQDDSSRERFSNGFIHIPPSTLHPEVLREGSLSPGFELKNASCTCSHEDLQQLKSEKDSLEMELARCTEKLEQSTCQLYETEQLLAELKSELVSSQKSNSLAETQLKCMAESYKSLETRTQGLDAEVNILRAKTETLDVQLQEEKQNHQNALAKCMELEEQIQRNESCSTCALSSATEGDMKFKQERDIAAAAERLAECQETIFLLGRQLEAMRPPSEHSGSPFNERLLAAEGFLEDENSPGRFTPEGIHSSQDFDQNDIEDVTSSPAVRAGSESPSDLYNSSTIPPDTDANLMLRSPVNSRRPKHRQSKSSSSSYSIMTPDKQSRGFSRFFSSKPKTGQ